MKVPIGFELNGYQVKTEVEPHLRLLDVLRDVLGDTGTKEGCGEGECGACTVLVDGLALNSCLLPVCEVDGSSVTTIEGVAAVNGTLSAVQQAFLDNGGSQCGFCTPGIIMSTLALLAENPDPTEQDIRYALTGNLCRCTGYVQIVQSIRAAASPLQGGSA